MGGAIIYTKESRPAEVQARQRPRYLKSANAGDMNYRVAAAVSMPLVTDKLAVR
jgi:hypothetical protein